MKKLLLPLALLGLGAMPATAQTAATTTQGAQARPASKEVQLVLEDYIVTTTTVNGKATEKLSPDATKARPGDIIQYELVAKNTTNGPLTNILPTLAVPAPTVFVATSGATAGTKTEFSYDGGKAFGAAPMFKTITVTENGKAVTKRVLVQPSEYTNVRWKIPALKPGETKKLILRVRVR